MLTYIKFGGILIIFDFLLYFPREIKHEKIIFLSIFFSLLLSGFQTEPKLFLEWGNFLDKKIYKPVV